jgi:hypothetical protein
MCTYQCCSLGPDAAAYRSQLLLLEAGRRGQLPAHPVHWWQPGLGDAWGHGREAERATLPAQAAPLATTWEGPSKARSPNCGRLRGCAALRCCRRGLVAPCGVASSPSHGHIRSGKWAPATRRWAARVHGPCAAAGEGA